MHKSREPHSDRAMSHNGRDEERVFKYASSDTARGNVGKPRMRRKLSPSTCPGDPGMKEVEGHRICIHCERLKEHAELLQEPRYRRSDIDD